MEKYSVIVLGSTGAVGKELVKELLKSKKCKQVIACTRKSILFNDIIKTFPGIPPSDITDNRLQISQIDYDHLMNQTFIDTNNNPFDGIFCCLGTTRKDAGSAEAFKKVDLHYVTKCGELAKKCNIKYFGLLTAMNANKDSWFLYPQTKGYAEKAIKDLKFPKTSIFRPPLIDRGIHARTIEKILLTILPSTYSISANDIAKAMVHDYEMFNESTGIHELNHKELVNLSKR